MLGARDMNTGTDRPGPARFDVRGGMRARQPRAAPIPAVRLALIGPPALVSAPARGLGDEPDAHAGLVAGEDKGGPAPFAVYCPIARSTPGAAHPGVVREPIA